MIRLENVHLRDADGHEALRGINLVLEPGAFCSLVGPAGAGKTSLLRLLWLGARPTQGKIELFGEDTRTLSQARRDELRRRIGIVFQQPRLIDHLSARENVALPLLITGSKRADAHHHAAELLDWVGVEDRPGAPASALSSGERQCVAIARAVITRPPLLLADEPMINLDAAVIRRLVRLLEELHRLETTILIATRGQHLIAHPQHRSVSIERGTMVDDMRDAVAV